MVYICIQRTLKSGSGNRFLNEPTIKSAPEPAVTIRPYVVVLRARFRKLGGIYCGQNGKGIFYLFIAYHF